MSPCAGARRTARPATGAACRARGTQCCRQRGGRVGPEGGDAPGSRSRCPGSSDAAAAGARRQPPPLAYGWSLAAASRAGRRGPGLALGRRHLTPCLSGRDAPSPRLGRRAIPAPRRLPGPRFLPPRARPPPPLSGCHMRPCSARLAPRTLRAHRALDSGGATAGAPRQPRGGARQGRGAGRPTERRAEDPNTDSLVPLLLPLPRGWRRWGEVCRGRGCHARRLGGPPTHTKPAPRLYSPTPTPSPSGVSRFLFSLSLGDSERGWSEVHRATGRKGLAGVFLKGQEGGWWGDVTTPV